VEARKRERGTGGKGIVRGGRGERRKKRKDGSTPHSAANAFHIERTPRNDLKKR